MKLKRLFTAVLSTALALSLCAMPAMAVDDAPATGTTPTKPATSTSTIDIGQKGSITIYKRAELKTKSNVAGTGEKVENPNGDVLPNAGFSIYRVLKAGDLVKYYDGLSTGTTPEITVDSCFNDTGSHTAENLKSEIQADPIQEEKYTDETGMVKFSELDVGLYLVIETKTPQAVTVPAEPFLVSIPMTRIGDTTAEPNNQNQKQWLYDVTVYPKNSIAKGTVKLVKQGEQGDKTTKLADVTFTLHKKDDRSEGYIQVGNVYTTNAEGEITLENLTKGRYYLQETGYTTGKDTGYILNTTGKFYFDINGDGKAVKADDPAVTDKDKVNGESFVIDTTSNTLTVTNYKPDIVKTVTKRDNTKDSHEADYGIGDAVPFTLTIDVPANVASLKTFKVTDTTDVKQLKHNEDSVIVKGIPADMGKTKVDFVKGTDYTLTIDDTTETMTVDFGATKSNNFTSVAGGKIIITYTATVQKTALVAGDGNVNTAKIVYSRETNLTEETGKEPYEITDKGVVYTFGLNIYKTAKGGTLSDKPLEGVTFDLYKKVDTEKKNTDGTYSFCDKPSCPATSGVNAKKLGLTDQETETWIKVDTLQTDADGKASVKGLPSGTYKLVETQTVKGYNLLSKPVDAKLNLTYSEAWTTTTKCETNGNLTKRTIKTPTYTRGDNVPVDPSAVIEIVNRAGFTLPVTGGFGTLLFSGIGVLLVLAGVGVLFSLKKKPNRA